MSRIAPTPRAIAVAHERERQQEREGNREFTENPNNRRTYRFIYFNIKARGELVRLIFHAVGVQFYDIRMENNAAWQEMKADTPLGTLPVLDCEGLELGQTMAIARFLAFEFGIRGKSVFEQAVVDSVAEAADDLLSDYLEVILSEKTPKKTDLRRRFVEYTLPSAMERFDRFQKEHSREYGYIVGNRLTYADLAVYNVIDQVLRSGLVEVGYCQRFRYPTELRKRVLTHSGLTKYFNTRPQTEI